MQPLTMNIMTRNVQHRIKSKVKKHVMHCASSQSASNALSFPVCERWSPQASRPARHSANIARPQIRASVSRDMPVYFPSFHRVLIPA